MRNSDEANLIRMKTLNACGESLFETKSFKEAAEKSRCIFPLHGFFEHQARDGQKVPHYIYR
jgi:putative SOS response-associated peptidase YedK